jgi:acetoacetate decarboxylase
MGTPGKLTKDQFGYCLPVDAPLYQRLPDYYKNVSMLLFDYVTDADAALALLPAELELADPPTATLVFAEYPWSTLGPYNEVAQALKCTYKGKPVYYAVRLHVTADSAMAAGREIAGFPKKMAAISFQRGDLYLSTVERPPGLRLASASFKPMAPVPPAKMPLPWTLPFVCLRLIPTPEESPKPSLVQLVGTRWVFTSGELWSGSGTFQFTGASDFDPYHKLPLRKQLLSLLFMGEMQVAAPGQILETL